MVHGVRTKGVGLDQDTPGWGYWIFPLRLGKQKFLHPHPPSDAESSSNSRSPSPSSSPSENSPFFVFGDWSGTVGWARKILPFLESNRPFIAIEDPLLSDPSGTKYGRTLNMSFAEYCLFLAKTIRTIQRSGPYFLLSYSVGGLVAFEVSRNLIHIHSAEVNAEVSGPMRNVIGSLILIDPQPIWDLHRNSSAKWYLTSFFLCDATLLPIFHSKMKSVQKKENRQFEKGEEVAGEGKTKKPTSHKKREGSQRKTGEGIRDWKGKTSKLRAERASSLWNFCLITLLYSQVPIHTLCGRREEAGVCGHSAREGECDFHSQLKRARKSLRWPLALEFISSHLSSHPPSASTFVSLEAAMKERLKMMFCLETDFAECAIAAHRPLPLSPALSQTTLISPLPSPPSLPVIDLFDYWRPLLPNGKTLSLPLSVGGYQIAYNLPFHGKSQTGAAKVHVYCVMDERFCRSVAKLLNKL